MEKHTLDVEVSTHSRAEEATNAGTTRAAKFQPQLVLDGGDIRNSPHQGSYRRHGLVNVPRWQAEERVLVIVLCICEQAQALGRF